VCPVCRTHYAHHQERKSIVQVSGAVVFKLLVWCGAEGCVSGLQDALCPSSGAQKFYTGGCCLWYLMLWFSSCRSGVGLRVVCPVSRMHYAHHQELKSIIQVVAACGIWCYVFQVVGLVWS